MTLSLTNLKQSIPSKGEVDDYDPYDVRLYMR